MMELDSESPASPRELTARELARVLVRVVALVTAVGVLVGLSSFITLLVRYVQDPPRQGDAWAGILLFGGGFLVTCLVILWLWMFPESIADRIVPEEYDGNIRFDLSFRELQALVASILGLYLLTLALPRLARLGAEYWFQLQEYRGNPVFEELVRSTSTPLLLEAVAQLVLAVLLFVWSRQIVQSMYLAKVAEQDSAAVDAI